MRNRRSWTWAAVAVLLAAAAAAVAGMPFSQPFSQSGPPKASGPSASSQSPQGPGSIDSATDVQLPQETQEPVSSVDAQLVAEGLTAPVSLASPGDGSGRLFVAEQTGVIKVVEGGQVLAEPFLDLRSRMAGLDPNYDERGLLGLAFHPQFAENGKFYVYYSAPLGEGAPSGWDHTSVVAEFAVQASDPGVADPASERIILRVDQPQMNHNGGQIIFGPDGFLYVPLGDGGNANDVGLGHPPIGNGQDKSGLLGSILRIDVDRPGLGQPEQPYSIPADNPFVGKEGADEIFAYGFRNPFRISFDALTGELFAGDVGQDLWEEVDIVAKGGNYGWNAREGLHCFSPQNPEISPESCSSAGPDGSPLIDPILEYRNAEHGGIGRSVIGGFVYRGSAIPGLEGEYVFGDWSRSESGDGSLFSASRGANGWEMRELSIGNTPTGRIGAFILSFGQDDGGELYVLTSGAAGPSGTGGKVYKLVPSG